MVKHLERRARSLEKVNLQGVLQASEMERHGDAGAPEREEGSR